MSADPIRASLVPDPAILFGFAAGKLTHLTAIGELIDNALDAGAKAIRIVFGPVQKGRNGAPAYMIVEDDGTGCSDLTAMVRIGKHVDHSTTKSGRYGVGGIDAALWYGGVDSVYSAKSTHEGKTRSLSLRWRSLAESGDWTIPLESAEMEARPGERGTQVSVTPIEKPLPAGEAWAKFRSMIGYTFSPAINRGAQIIIARTVKGVTEHEPVAPWRLPEFEPGAIKTTVSVAGREALVHVGIVKAGVANPRPGFTYWFGDRVIKENSAAGCGEYSCGRICGVVELRGKGWRLNKNKDGFGSHEDDLFDAVFEATQFLLKRADTIGQNLESAVFTSNVESLLNARLGDPDAKAKRADGEKTGTKEPTGRGGRHRRARREQDGQTFTGKDGKPIRSIKIEYHDLGDRIGECQQVGRGRARVLLSKEHPLIKRIVAAKNTDAVLIQVMNLCAATRFSGKQLELLNVPGNDFEDVVGAALKEPAALDGADISPDAKKASGEP